MRKTSSPPVAVPRVSHRRQLQRSTVLLGLRMSTFLTVITGVKPSVEQCLPSLVIFPCTFTLLPGAGDCRWLPCRIDPGSGQGVALSTGRGFVSSPGDGDFERAAVEAVCIHGQRLDATAGCASFPARPNAAYRFSRAALSASVHLRLRRHDKRQRQNCKCAENGDFLHRRHSG